MQKVLHWSDIKDESVRNLKARIHAIDMLPDCTAFEESPDEQMVDEADVDYISTDFNYEETRRKILPQ